MLQLLINSLEEMTDVHAELLQASIEKKGILIAGDIDSLSQLMAQESKLVKQLGKLEEERMFQTKQYVESRGLVAEEITLTQLLSIIPNPHEREKIKDLADKLLEMITQLKENNELNARLIQDSLDYINHSIELVTESQEDELNYQGPVSTSNPSSLGRSFFDTKA